MKTILPHPGASPLPSFCSVDMPTRPWIDRRFWKIVRDNGEREDFAVATSSPRSRLKPAWGRLILSRRAGPD
jgi:hypothetical protein